jgi:Lrp/AsnC family transcriptional regulator, leucine-responsive regulatory protein
MIKKTDLLLINALRQNARETLTNISKTTRVPISTLFDRLHSQQNSAIMKHTTILDFEKLGYGCRANLLLAVKNDQKSRLCAYLKEHSAINNLYKINNGFDFLAEGIFLSIKDMEKFLGELENNFDILKKQENYLIEDIKREGFLSRMANE